MAKVIRINPIDLELDVAVGVDLPVIGSVGTTFKLNYTTLDQASANARNLLLTDRGERVMLPEFGCDLRKSLFETLTPSLVTTLEARIRESFAYWLPYVAINQLTLTPDPTKNLLGIVMIISLKGNLLDTRSIELTLSVNGQ